jgi:hypothetical protein
MHVILGSRRSGRRRGGGLDVIAVVAALILVDVGSPRPMRPPWSLPLLFIFDPAAANRPRCDQLAWAISAFFVSGR